MRSPPSRATLPTKTVAFTELYEASSGEVYKRRRGTQDWTLITPSDNSPPSNQSILSGPDHDGPEWFTIHIVRFRQFPGDPLHWAICVSPTERPSELDCHVANSPSKTSVTLTHRYEVRGDFPLPMLKYDSVDVREVHLLDDYIDAWEVCTCSVKEWEKNVKGVIEQTEGPRGEGRDKEERENCQDWCVWVVKGLVDICMVEVRILEMLEELVGKS